MLAEVVEINRSEIYEQIILFLEKKTMRSESLKTREAYDSDIRDFFKFKAKKEIEFLNKNDVKLNDDDIVKFQIYLKNDRGLLNKSINRKISTVNQFYGQLYRRGYIENLAAFDEADRLKEGKNHHGVLTVEEVFQAAELVKNQPRGRKRLTKYYLILTAMDTCLRKSALLNLTWDDFILHDDEVEIRAVDKGNEERNLRISKEFYEELVQIKNESGTNKVFDISDTSIQSMMNYIKRQLKFEDKRNVVFHSFRKAGVTFQYRLTNDLLQAKKASGHKNMENLLIYIGERDLGVLGAVSSKGDIDDQLFKKVSHEELLKGISSLTKDQILLLNLKLKEMTQLGD